VLIWNAVDLGEKIAFTCRPAAALRQNDLANRRPPMPSLAITRGGTLSWAVPDADRSVIYEFAMDR
jgi:hypothetical protein